MAPNDLSVMLLNMNLNLIIVGLGEVNGTVIDGAARPADADRRSQKTMYNNLKGITAALPGTGGNFTYIHNEGKASYTGINRSEGNIIVYNGPNAHASFSGSGSSSGKINNHGYRCKNCRQKFDSEERHQRHRRDYPKFCGQHQMCHNSWTAHIDQFSHTKCPYHDCQNEYPSEEQLENHFLFRHR